MIKVSDYIIDRLVDYGVRDVFMISGGGAMHLNDSVGKCAELNYICNHHEQASAIAAEGYARSTGKLAVVIVTTGPGGTNTMTGVIGQWTDSVPVLYLSGQVKQETTLSSCPGLPLRQLGDQEVNIINLVKPVTKYAEMVTSASEIKAQLEKAIHIATSGRPGPVWLDIPLDIQGALINTDELLPYVEEEVSSQSSDLNSLIEQVVSMMKASKRPVLVAGHGIRIAKAQQLFLSLIEQFNIPVVSTFNGFDLIDTDHPCFVGRIGTIGDRAGNFALQNADLVLFVGTRNNIRQASYNWQSFARNAKKVVVDIDSAELQKPTVVPDLPILADAGNFLQALIKELEYEPLPDWSKWVAWNQERKAKYDVVLEEYKHRDKDVHPYHFIRELTKSLPGDGLMVAGNGTACVVLFQAGHVKKGQRIFWNSGCASMGYDLPAAIGMAFANKGKDVVCLTGEGSLQMNLQELQTIKYHELPIKLFILNNKGYCSIRQTQTSYFDGRFVACDHESGLDFPDMGKLAAALGISYRLIDSHQHMETDIAHALQMKGPVIIDVQLTLDYIFSPKLSSERLPDGRMVSKPLEDMYPFLDREEFLSNMIESKPIGG